MKTLKLITTATIIGFTGLALWSIATLGALNHISQYNQVEPGFVAEFTDAPNPIQGSSPQLQGGK